MTLQETSSRDPAFYRWHLFIDDVFLRYKDTLPPYKIEEVHIFHSQSHSQYCPLCPHLTRVLFQLEFEGIAISELKIQPANLQKYENVNNGEPTPTLRTKWVKDRVDITNGIDKKKMKYLTVKKVYYEYVHLGHDNFSYEITVC